MSFNLAMMLRESAAVRPDKALVHAGDAAFTYAEVDAISGRVAASLRGLGLEPVDKNVYPREVEEVLYEHADVVEAAVLGRPVDRLGEEVVAFVALRPGTTVGPAELTAHPKGATGKILKRELRR